MFGDTFVCGYFRSPIYTGLRYITLYAAFTQHLGHLDPVCYLSFTVDLSQLGRVEFQVFLLM